VPRDLNFIDHTSELGWKRHERFEKIIVDPSLYMDRNTEPFPSKEIRQMPDTFQIFTGVSWHYFLFRLIWTAGEFTKKCIILFCSVLPG